MVIGRENGFSLLELAVTLTISGFLVAFSITRYLDNELVLMSEVETFKSHVRFVRQLAIANEPNQWEMGILGTGYRLLRDGVESQVALPGQNDALRSFPPGIEISVRYQGANVSKVTFDEWGGPLGDSDYFVEISDTNSGESAAFRIVSNTGAIR